MMISEPFQEECYYHVYNRGNNKEAIFRENGNFIYFLRLSEKYLTPLFEIYAYCLLNNHFHFLVCVRTGIRSSDCIKAFSNLFNAYAKAYNKRYGRTGRLFQERFKRKHIDKNEYLTQVIGYIHLNPSKHGLKKGYLLYPFSSYNLVLEPGSGIIEKQKVLDWFGGNELYQKFHKDYSDLAGFQNPRGLQED